MRKLHTLFTALVLAAVIAAVVLLFAAIATTTSAHEEPSSTPPYVTSDSVRVQLELDADGDGVWEVRHIFNDKAGVWDRSSSGQMRVTWTKHYTDGPDTADTNRGYFWRDLYADNLDSVGMVDLGNFAAFGRSYGNPKTMTPDGLQMWDVWSVNADSLSPDFGDSTRSGYFYFYPATRED